MFSMKKWFLPVLFACISLFIASCEDVDDIGKSNSGSGVKLEFVYGGVSGNPVEDPNVKISNLRIHGRSGMSYSWSSGTSLAAWGLSNGDAGAYACMFYEKDGRWVGGKFDWISTSRTTRDFINLNAGYGGWKPDEFYAAKKHGFCIMSSDRRKRSNFITD